MNYPEAIEWLYGRQQTGIKLGLENTQRLLDELGLPAAGMRIVHVAGTNGKGSTCAFAESVLRQSGYRTGLFTSPHLVSFCERIRVGGKPVAEAEAARGIAMLREHIGGDDEGPTFFELATALALHLFAQHEVEIAVVEVGLGGRLDSTNALSPTICGIAPVGLDHRQILGESLAEIAAEKAGILKPGVPAVSAPQEPEARGVIERRAAEVGAPLRFVDRPWGGEISLLGEHQRWNATLAVDLLRAGGFELKEGAVEKGLADTHWRGRFERIAFGDGREIVIDGAHNAAGTAALCRTWQEVFGVERPTIILSAAADKDSAALVAPLAKIATRFICTVPATTRETASPEDLVALIPDGIPAESASSVAEALDAAQKRGGKILAAGSLFLAGELISLLDGDRDRYEASDQ
jgi:dihydrofolate synthase/folylpolyglutamate synthase